MAKLIVMIVMLISLIVADNILVIIADKIIDSMIQSKMARSLVKIAIFMIMIHIVGWGLACWFSLVMVLFTTRRLGLPLRMV